MVMLARSRTNEQKDMQCILGSNRTVAISPARRWALHLGPICPATRLDRHRRNDRKSAVPEFLAPMPEY